MNTLSLGFTPFIVLFEGSSKSTIHPFGALGTRTNVLFEALVVGHFPFLFLLHSPRD